MQICPDRHNRRQPTLGHELADLSALTTQQWRWHHDERFGLLASHGHQCLVHFSGVARLQEVTRSPTAWAARSVSVRMARIAGRVRSHSTATRDIWGATSLSSSTHFPANCSPMPSDGGVEAGRRRLQAVVRCSRVCPDYTAQVAARYWRSSARRAPNPMSTAPHRPSSQRRTADFRRTRRV